ncbi:MAG: phosphoenolpyruvate synthase, partial [Pseudomonas stutzeri]|nr:phosphoenolpyruvate synthase [Stutzerimonas stutzeri]
MNADDWREWQSRFQAHLQHYGHTIYNLDFANPVPADDPAPLLETFKLFISGQGVNPHARQQAAAERREQATQAVLKRLKGLRLNLFRKFLTPAQRYAPLREDGLADVGLSYPLLRQMLLEVGRRFAEGGMIEQPDDIFWLK